MKRSTALAIALVLLVAPFARAADPTVGSPAPAFSLQGSDGKTYSLAEFAGKEGVVLAWFPKAFTPGWTEELQALRDSADAIGAFEVAAFMVSLDAAEKNADFAKALDARHVLLSDPTGETAKAYGVSGLGGFFAKRWTFYIDKSGTIVAIDKDVKTETAGQDIARKLAELGFAKR